MARVGPASRGAPRPAPRDPNTKAKHSLDIHGKRTEQYTSKSTESNQREEYEFLGDKSRATNDSLRRNVSEHRVISSTKSPSHLLPVFLDKRAKGRAESPSSLRASLGSRPVGSEPEVKDVFASVVGPNSQLMNVILPVSGLNSQADRRETMRLRKMTAQLAAGADSALKSLRATASDSALGGADAAPGLPAPNDTFENPIRDAATPPHTPPAPEFRYPPQMRAPPAGVRVQTTTISAEAAAAAEKTAELLSVNTVLSGLVQVPHDLSPPRARTASAPHMAEGREGGHSFDINDKLGERQWGKAHTPPMSPWQGSTSPGGLSMPDETSAVDAEVARISRVAEKLGLRPLGVDKEEADWAVNTEMLEGLGASPMQAFREASKLYRHLFFSLFRQEMNTCHPRGEALAYLWFSLDKFLEQVCGVAQTHHRNSMHEASKRAELEATVERLSSQLRSTVKSRQDLEMKLANARLGHGDTAPQIGAGMPGGKARGQTLSRSKKWDELEAIRWASARGAKATREASTQATLDSITIDVASSMKESLGYTKLSPYQLTHEEMVEKPLVAGDAALRKLQYKTPAQLVLRPDAVAKRTDAGLLCANAPGITVGDIGMQMRMEQLHAQVDRLKMAHLELRNCNETLNAEYKLLQHQTRDRVREVEQSNMVMKQQLYRAQALLRNKALLTVNGVQQHAADINSLLAFPDEPLWAMGEEPSGNEPGLATGNTALFEQHTQKTTRAEQSMATCRARDGSQAGVQTPASACSPAVRERKAPRMLYKGSRRGDKVTTSYDPQIAMHTQMQYTVKEMLDAAMLRVDDAIADAWKYPSCSQNLHRNHVRHTIFSLRQAALSHGMDIFCDRLMKQLEFSVRETAESGTGTGEERGYAPSMPSPGPRERA